MATERYYNPATNRYETRETKSQGDIESALSKEKLQSTAGSGLGAKGNTGRGQAPKQNPGESLSEFSARMRKFREQDPDGKARVKAMK